VKLTFHSSAPHPWNELQDFPPPWRDAINNLLISLRHEFIKVYPGLRSFMRLFMLKSVGKEHWQLVIKTVHPKFLRFLDIVKNRILAGHRTIDTNSTLDTSVLRQYWYHSLVISGTIVVNQRRTWRTSLIEVLEKYLVFTWDDTLKGKISHSRWGMSCMTMKSIITPIHQKKKIESVQDS